jgi:predicted HTH domain antitoxin
MDVVVPDELVRASGLTVEELPLELAVHLFREERLTLGQAARLADLSQAEFLDVLGSRQIPIHYGVEDLRQDVETLEKLFPK